MNVRKLALDTLSKCESAAQYSNLALDAKIKQFNISGDDRSLFTVLVYGVIEHKLTLDYYINSLSSMPKEKIEPSTRNILRLGLYQIIFMRTADHAAVNETVALAPQRSRGFVNAILRNYLRKKDSIPLPSDADERISVKYSFPAETCRRFIQYFGADETEKLLAAMNEPPMMTLRVNTLKTSRDALLKKLSDGGINAEATSFSPFGIRLSESVPYPVIDSLCRGEFFVQDEASQISTAVLGATDGMRVIDMCACPGSKSFGAALTMENKGELLAFDLSKSKLPLIASGAERLGIDIISSSVRDGRDFIPELEGSADRIICDVPCSGFGVVAKKPEIRYKDINSAEALPDIQYDILCNAARYLKKGGVMVYSTCTVLPEENEENIKRFLLAHPEFSAIPFNVGGLSAECGMITLFPHIHGTDGFFICKLIKQ
jgi:16S rRNA (cytosine967-C5)-methyltransferase